MTYRVVEVQLIRPDCSLEEANACREHMIQRMLDRPNPPAAPTTYRVEEEETESDSMLFDPW